VLLVPFAALLPPSAGMYGTGMGRMPPFKVYLREGGRKGTFLTLLSCFASAKSG